MGTIAAIATPAGAGGVGIVRVSGKNAKKIFNKYFNTENSEIRERYAYFGNVRDQAGKVLDTGIGLFFMGPNSYTGEDVAEFQVHGAPFVLREFLDIILKSNLARLAQPGEFTRRAFLNGKITLPNTERLNLLLQAETKLQFRVVQELKKGKMAGKIREIRESLLALMTRIEASIEYPEEEDTGGILLSIHEDTVSLIKELKKLADTYDKVVQWSEGVRVVLSGAPNSGKSSLLNAIVGYKRAIVTAVPGTTRDTVEVAIDIQGLRCTFVDTAGLREPDDEVEAAGIKRAKNEIQLADAIIVLWDSNKAPDRGEMEDVTATSVHLVKVQSKADLHVKRLNGFIPVSAKTGEGVGDLLMKIRRLFDDVDLDHVFLFTKRQKIAVKAAVSALKTALPFLEKDQTIDMAAAHLGSACRQLETIIGMVTTDELLDGIFSNFCLGK